MKSIGGYFTLELPLRNAEYHNNAVKVNSGKNAFEYILASYGYDVKRVYLPYFTSRIMIKPLQEHNIPCVFYHINERLELTEEIELDKNEFLVYTNYFGLKGKYLECIAKKYGKQLVVDNAQAFFDIPLSGVNTFYSPRKFFGVLDGGYAYTQGTVSVEMQDSISYNRMGYLLKRIDTSAEEAYADYKSSCMLGDLTMSKMSKVTQRILESIDYDVVATVRRRNYNILAKRLFATNQLNINVGDGVPLIYPYLTDSVKLRSYLIANKVYVAQYWPNVLEWCKPEDFEYQLTENLVCIPIDQRYGEKEMEYIVDKIQEIL